MRLIPRYRRSRLACAAIRWRVSGEIGAAAVDAWAADRQTTRSEAIRRLVELGLKVKKS